jgi:site-specific DNA-cytosine methylase
MPEQKAFLEFFAGIGLVHMGLRRSRWECVYANDISEKKEEMYRDEFPDATYSVIVPHCHVCRAHLCIPFYELYFKRAVEFLSLLSDVRMYLLVNDPRS